MQNNKKTTATSKQQLRSLLVVKSVALEKNKSRQPIYLPEFFQDLPYSELDRWSFWLLYQLEVHRVLQMGDQKACLL